MKKLFVLLILSFSLMAQQENTSIPKETTAVQPTQTLDVEKLSEALGFMIGEQLHQNDCQLNIPLLVQSLKDAADGKKNPMTKEECIAHLSSYQQKVLDHQADKNLQEAEKFLQENKKNKEIVELEKGKLQYKIQKVGTGETIQSTATPLIRYKGTLLDGTLFDTTEEPLALSLNETIPGFTKGITGMKEGEVRTLYIHPDLAYGKEGTLPPNSLLTFEIEVVKAAKPQETKEVAQEAKAHR
jgi:peptidylprolyl isomerase